MSLSASFKCIAVLVPLLASSSAEAATINPGTLFTQPYRDQVAAWLGADVTFANIYSQNAGDDAGTWHAAVDGKGATVTLIQTNLGLIGGYDPLSWRTASDGAYYNLSESPSERTAFIFNLSTSLFLPQTQGFNGQYQTFNYGAYGPTFGGGHDIHVDGSLSAGYGGAFSYAGDSGVNVFGYADTQIYSFSISKIETFSVSPEPSTWLLLASSFGAMLLSRGRLRKK